MTRFLHRHDDTRRKLALRSSQPGHPIRARVTISVVGRMSLGRSAPRSWSIDLDLLFGQESEAHLFRQIQDAIESTYYSDIHMSQRRAQEATIAVRQAAMHAEHAAWEAKRSELTFTAERALKKRSAGRSGDTP